jgi:hypothetical protein
MSPSSRSRSGSARARKVQKLDRPRFTRVSTMGVQEAPRRSRQVIGLGLLWLMGAMISRSNPGVRGCHRRDAGVELPEQGCCGRRCHSCVNCVGQSGSSRGVLWRGVCSFGRRFPNPTRTTPAVRICRAQDCWLVAGLDVGPVLGCPGIPSRMSLASRTIAALLRLLDALRHSGAARPPTTTGRPIARATWVMVAFMESAWPERGA